MILVPQTDVHADGGSEDPSKATPLSSRTVRIPQTVRTNQRARLRQPPGIAATVSQKPTPSPLWTFLLLGLVFCLLDFAYIFKFVMDDRFYDGPQPTPLVDRNNTRVPGKSDFLMQAPLMPDLADDENDRSRDESEDTQEDVKSDAEDSEEADMPSTQEKQKDTAGVKPALRKNVPNHDVETPAFHVDFDPLSESSHILNLLHEAGVELNAETYARLPQWSDVTALYGSKPVFVGLESCKRFQSMGIAADHFVSVAGTFNTGTNALSENLIANCHMPKRIKKYGARNRGVRWQVNWGKHTPVGDEQFRQGHRTYNTTDPSLATDNIFPGVAIRDPYKWMQSMCRHEYGARWRHDKSRHCPNLVPNNEDRAAFPVLRPLNVTSVPVRVVYAEFERHHASLAHFWNDWYQEYVNATFPRLLVRFEDLVFHPQLVTKTVCECAGGEMNKRPFKYIVESAKVGSAHGPEKAKTSYVDAIVKYGTEKSRYDGFEPADLAYLRKHLNANLMQLFGYKYHDSTLEEEEE
jgi:hypothetical protein